MAKFTWDGDLVRTISRWQQGLTSIDFNDNIGTDDHISGLGKVFLKEGNDDGANDAWGDLNLVGTGGVTLSAISVSTKFHFHIGDMVFFQLRGSATVAGAGAGVIFDGPEPLSEDYFTGDAAVGGGLLTNAGTRRPAFVSGNTEGRLDIENTDGTALGAGSLVFSIFGFYFTDNVRGV